MSRLKKWLSGEGQELIPKDVMQTYNKSKQQIDEIAERIESMRQSFVQGGSILFDDLATYIVSTPETPVRYETGDRCYAYRLPCDDPDKLIFYCEFEPKPGKAAKYGWHNHPDADEVCVQLTEKGYVNAKEVPRFTVSFFPAGEYHDYEMKQPGVILVTFTRVNSK